MGVPLPWERCGAVLPVKMRGWTELQGFLQHSRLGWAGELTALSVMQKQARGEVCRKEVARRLWAASDPAGVRRDPRSMGPKMRGWGRMWGQEM